MRFSCDVVARSQSIGRYRGFREGTTKWQCLWAFNTTCSTLPHLPKICILIGCLCNTHDAAFQYTLGRLSASSSARYSSCFGISSFNWESQHHPSCCRGSFTVTTECCTGARAKETAIQASTSSGVTKLSRFCQGSRL